MMEDTCGKCNELILREYRVMTQTSLRCPASAHGSLVIKYHPVYKKSAGYVLTRFFYPESHSS
jgi:hypothetical protein